MDSQDRRRLAIAALVAGLALGCGDPDEDYIHEDWGDGSVGQYCDPVTQRGCSPGEKCSWIVFQVSPTLLGGTACVRDGAVDLGDACIDTCIPEGSTDIGEPCDDFNTPDSSADPHVIGTDDCKAGGLCVDRVCKPICQGGGCSAEQACVAHADLFTDNEDVGVCTATCDPLLQDCGPGLGCYIDPFPGHGFATCETELHPDRVQGDACPEGDCALNGCAAGYGPWVTDPDAWNVLCTAFSAPIDTYLDDPDGDGNGPLVGNPLGAPSLDCSEARIGVAGHQSYFLQSFYGNTTDTPPAWGICAPSGIENGDCAQFSVAFLLATYDAAEADPGPPTGREALDDLCATTERCGYGCVSNATYDELADAYCAAHASSPACGN